MIFLTLPDGFLIAPIACVLYDHVNYRRVYVTVDIIIIIISCTIGRTFPVREIVNKKNKKNAHNHDYFPQIWTYENHSVIQSVAL